MKILHVSDTDLPGRRFNGHDLLTALATRGHETRQCVWNKLSDDPRVIPLARSRVARGLNRGLRLVESRLSIQNLILPFAARLPFLREFREADVVHLHLIHNGFFSLLLLPLLSRLKPTVWTLHDPWALTGHCLHPGDCDRWRNGCGHCPDLETAPRLRRDHTAPLWALKRRIYRSSPRVHVVVASAWMERLVRASPLTRHWPVHHVPFGLDLAVHTRVEGAREALGVFPGSSVIAFRATDGEHKGLDAVLEALRRLRHQGPVCLLTFQDRGRVDEFRGRYQIIDLGWVSDTRLLAQALSAADVFVMPSTAEAFGMMAVEAMACGCPVIVAAGTALPEVVRVAEGGGVVVPARDPEALRRAIERLLGEPAARLDLGRRAARIAHAHYGEAAYLDRLEAVYDACTSSFHGTGERSRLERPPQVAR